MKRNDGINHALPISTYAFGKVNPRRWHVVMASGSNADIWCGTQLVLSCTTFEEAVTKAQVFAKGVQP